MISYSMQNISLYQLRYFMAVARNASFSKAAIECHVAQTAISQQISSLEHTIGFTLFERDNIQVKLTGVGEIFFENVSGIMISLENAFLRMERSVTAPFLSSRTSPSADYNIRIGYYGGWEQMILPNIIQMFKDKYPGASVSSNYILPRYIIDSLERDIVDVVFTSAIHKFDLSNVEYMLIGKSPINLVVPLDHRFATRNEVSLSELASENFVPFNPTNAEHRTNYIHNNVVITDYFSAMVPHLATDMHNILLSVESGLGVSFFPEACKKYIARSKVHFLKLKESATPVNMHVIWKKNTNNDALPFFTDMIRQKRDNMPSDISLFYNHIIA